MTPIKPLQTFQEHDQEMEQSESFPCGFWLQEHSVLAMLQALPLKAYKTVGQENSTIG